jgi:hypothetical protein
MRNPHQRLVIHPLRMFTMVLPFWWARLPGWGISPGVRPLLRWARASVWLPLQDADLVRAMLVRWLRRR